MQRIKSILLVFIVTFSLVSPASAAPKTQSFSGTDDEVITVIPFKDSVLVTATYEGESNFIVYPVDGTGKRGYSWFNQIDSWSGRIFQQNVTKPWAAIAVQTVGDWSITITPLSSAKVVNPKSYSGSGSDVIKFNKASKGLKKLTVTHNGDSNFFVRPISSKGKQGYSLVNEIGAYSGTTLLPSGTLYLAIIGDGDWTISVN
jgi:hypothetical protein